MRLLVKEEEKQHQVKLTVSDKLRRFTSDGLVISPGLCAVRKHVFYLGRINEGCVPPPDMDLASLVFFEPSTPS